MLMEWRFYFRFDFVKSRILRDRKSNEGLACASGLPLSAVPALFSRKLPATRDASGQKLLDTFGFKSIREVSFNLLFFLFFFP
jgi:hypothetical protein